MLCHRYFPYFHTGICLRHLYGGNGH